MLNEVITRLISRDISLDLDFPLNRQKRKRSTQSWHWDLGPSLISASSWLRHKSFVGCGLFPQEYTPDQACHDEKGDKPTDDGETIIVEKRCEFRHSLRFVSSYCSVEKS